MRAVTPRALRQLPKVEVHVHLEGSIRAETAVELAQRHGEDPARVLLLEDGGFPARYADFQHFLATFLAVSRQIRRPEDLETIATAFARQQADQQVRYSEATFTAGTHVGNGMDPEAMWQALADGFAAVPEVSIGIIVDAVRHLGVAAAEATVQLVEQGLEVAPIVGLGLTGIEGSEPEGAFRLLRQAADRLGLGLAAHAGETGTPGNVQAAIDDLGADRIGHGIAVAQDPALLERVVAAGVPFEICPSSNVKLGIVGSLDDHPLGPLWRAGLQVTINSDDPPFFDTTLTQELEHAARIADLDRADLAESQRRAIRAAFTDRATRTRILAEIDAWERDPGTAGA